MAEVRAGSAPVHAEGDDIVERAIGNFRQVDGDYGKRLEVAVQALRG
ncbi:hypothetical protein [Streptomyces sp. NPDC002845]